MSLCAAVVSTGETLRIEVPPTDAWVFVEQDVPADTVVEGVSDGGVWDPATRRLKWGPLDALQGRTLTFSASGAPADAITATRSYPPTATVASEVTFRQDTDGDGLPDVDEVAAGLDPAVADATVDVDGDGLSAAAEARLGTDPLDGNSGPQILSVEVAPDGSLLFRVREAQADRTVLEGTPFLSELNNWSPLPGIWEASAEAGVSVYRVAEGQTPQGALFVRLRLE